MNYHFNTSEEKAQFYRLLEDKYGLTRVDVCLGSLDTLPETQEAALENDVKALRQGVPVQYITGFEYFCGHKFLVGDGVLIPRPETAELVSFICNKHKEQSQCRILDIGCGSGAIAVSLKKQLPKANITACDISEHALHYTRLNASLNDVNINIQQSDALNLSAADVDTWDAIVSNPPYICQSEAKDMDRQVLEHEPHIALFVPDNDPLLFYRNIASYATHALCHEGMLYFEINERFGHEVSNLLNRLSFTHVTILKDQFEKDRFVTAVKP